jgi:hypothetical protein
MDLDDITGGLSLKDLVTSYVDISKARLASGLAGQANTIDQLKGTVSLLAQQNQAQLLAQQSASTFDTATILKWGLLVGGVFIVWKMVK